MGNNEHKHTFRVGQTKVTTFLPTNHPVYKGFFQAIQLCGGTPPDHVGAVRLKPDTIYAGEKGQVICGLCFYVPRGGSLIEIYAGSILAFAGRSFYSQVIETRYVTLHEMGHSEHSFLLQNGQWVDRSPRVQVVEDYADNYATEILKRREKLEHVPRKFQRRQFR